MQNFNVLHYHGLPGSQASLYISYGFPFRLSSSPQPEKRLTGTWNCQNLIWPALNMKLIRFFSICFTLFLLLRVFLLSLRFDGASLTSRKPLWEQNVLTDIQRFWSESGMSAPVVNSHLVADPTIQQSGFDLPWHQWSLLNRFRTAQLGHCGACRKWWRLTDSELRSCGETQTMSPTVDSCPLIMATATPVCRWWCGAPCSDWQTLEGESAPERKMASQICSDLLIYIDWILMVIGKD